MRICRSMIGPVGYIILRMNTRTIQIRRSVGGAIPLVGWLCLSEPKAGRAPLLAPRCDSPTERWAVGRRMLIGPACERSTGMESRAPEPEQRLAGV